MQDRELTLAAARASATEEETKQAHKLHKETLVSVLDLLAPSCISSLLTGSGSDAWRSSHYDFGGATEAPDHSDDASEFYAMRLQIASSAQVGKNDAKTVIDRLTFVVGNAVYAAECAAQVESTLQSRKAAAEASARSNIPALQDEIARAQAYVADLVELLEIKEGELEDAHSRLSQAADTAEGLAVTLRDQETEIRILHAALEDAQDEAAHAAANHVVEPHSIATQVCVCSSVVLVGQSVYLVHSFA